MRNKESQRNCHSQIGPKEMDDECNVLSWMGPGTGHSEKTKDI